MKIWIINQYATLPVDGIGGRHRHLARELAELGHQVTVVAARWTHLSSERARARGESDLQDFEGFKFLKIDLPMYNGAHDRRRILNWFLFALKLLFLRRRLGHEPDVLLYSSPAPFGFLTAELLARTFIAGLVFEVRDIWPLSLRLLGNHSSRNPLIRSMQWIEDRAYKKAHQVVSNLPGALAHMVSRGMDRRKFTWIPNGISAPEYAHSGEETRRNLDEAAVRTFRVGYAGTIGLANALDVVLDTAYLLRHESQVIFVLTGKGDARAALEARARTLGLKNVVFQEPVSKAQVQSLLLTYDVCLHSLNDLPLYEYGIAANKLFDYFYASKPVVHSYSGKYDPVHEYEAGLTVPAGDPQALATAIIKLKNLPASERARLGANGYRAVLSRHEYKDIASQLELVLLEASGTARAINRPPTTDLGLRE